VLVCDENEWVGPKGRMTLGLVLSDFLVIVLLACA